MNKLGLLFALGAYTAYTVLVYRIAWRILIVWKSSGGPEGNLPVKTTPVAVLKAMGEILFLPRLFAVNPRLWIGEWIFHISFFLVILRHLRYVLDPVPGWVSVFQQPGVWAGYILPLSLVYILSIKDAFEEYRSRLNLTLLGIVIFTSFTGLLSKCPWTSERSDLVAVKGYVVGIFAFAPAIWPGSVLLGVHFLSALVLLACLPTHIFAAPFSLLDSRKRDEDLNLLMHKE